MSIQLLSRRVFRVMRRTTLLMAPREAAVSMGPDVNKCPLHPATVEIQVEGTGDLTGTITVVGKVGGVNDQEQIDVTGPIGSTSKWIGTTCKLFDCVTLIQTTGLADETPKPLIRARFVGSGGNPIAINCDLTDCLYGHLEHPGRQTWPMQRSGAQETGRPWIAHDDVYGFSPRRGDFYVEQRPDAAGALADYRVWEVEGNPEHLGALRSVHWELNVKESNAADLQVVTSI